MKYYLFLTSLIRSLGGGHIYTRNKIKYLQNIGYEVNFFHANIKRGEIIVQELIPYINNCDSHLQYPCYFFSRKVQDEVISKICNIFPRDCNEIIIESQTLICSTWGEMIARRLNAKHFVYLLSEVQYLRNSTIYDFMKFKLNRKELAGIQHKSLSILFKDWQSIKDEESYYLLANCTNVVEEIPYSNLSSLPKSEYTIGSIGRIDKLFLFESLRSIREFIKLYSITTFTILLIGGASQKKAIKKITKLFKNIANVKIFITGLIFPIPLELVLVPDVYISTAGSCYVSSEVGKLTISVDTNDLKPIGIVGKTTDNVLFRSGESEISLIDLLESILIKNNYKSLEATKKFKGNTNYDYGDHIEFLLKSNNSKKYFDISKAGLGFRDRIEKLLLSFFGLNLTPKIFEILSPVWMKLSKRVNI